MGPRVIESTIHVVSIINCMGLVTHTVISPGPRNIWINEISAKCSSSLCLHEKDVEIMGSRLTPVADIQFYIYWNRNDRTFYSPEGRFKTNEATVNEDGIATFETGKKGKRELFLWMI